VSLDAIGIVTGDAAKSVQFYALLGVTLTKFGDHVNGDGNKLHKFDVRSA